MSDTLSIIIPCYNEARTLGRLLELVAAAPLGEIKREIIIVDDGSQDDSGAIAAKFAAARNDTRLIRRANGGKGAAVRDGINASTGNWVIIQDADLEYNPAEYARLLAPACIGGAKVVYGSRERQPGNAASSWRFYAGGLLLTWWINLLFWTHLTDEPTCYKLFSGELIRKLPFENNCFGWEPEVTAKLLRLKYKIVEVPISYIPRHIAEGKKIRAKDGLKALWLALYWRFKRVELR